MAIGSVVPVDPYRAVVFPNQVREQRIRRGHPKLLAFAAIVPDIPYIRLSKIERGEVFARADEILRIAAALAVPARDLLLDIGPDFDTATWFLPFADGTASDGPQEAEFAVLLAAAVRALRDADPRLTAATIEADHGIAPVILSRIENAQKGLERWNAQTVANLCRLFGVDDEAALRAGVLAMHRDGALARCIATIATAEQRLARSRQRIASLAGEIERAAPESPESPAPHAPAVAAVGARMLAVFGTPLADGLIAMTPTASTIEAPAAAGPRAFGLRVGRATLGGGLPGQATVIVDPDRFPQAGGLALVRHEDAGGDGYRIVAVALDRDGRMLGYATHPECEIAIDALPPADIAAVVAAQFV